LGEIAVLLAVLPVIGAESAAKIGYLATQKLSGPLMRFAPTTPNIKPVENSSPQALHRRMLVESCSRALS
jgi:hypothetical protein